MLGFHVYPSSARPPTQSARPPAVQPTIHFDGDWTPGPRRLLEGAIAEAEAYGTFRAAGADAPHGIMWVCYCKRLPAAMVYVVHRVGWPGVLSAYHPAELGLKILDATGCPERAYA